MSETLLPRNGGPAEETRENPPRPGAGKPGHPRAGGPADAGGERCDPDQVERIAHGRYTEACLAIGQANLPTILAAEQRVSVEIWTAQAGGEPHRGYLGRLQLVKARRRRLQAEAQRRRSAAGQRATFRV